jgi:hypothetical protein
MAVAGGDRENAAPHFAAFQPPFRIVMVLEAATVLIIIPVCWVAFALGLHRGASLRLLVPPAVAAVVLTLITAGIVAAVFFAALAAGLVRYALRTHRGRATDSDATVITDSPEAVVPTDPVPT